MRNGLTSTIGSKATDAKKTPGSRLSATAQSCTRTLTSPRSQAPLGNAFKFCFEGAAKKPSGAWQTSRYQAERYQAEVPVHSRNPMSVNLDGSKAVGGVAFGLFGGPSGKRARSS